MRRALWLCLLLLTAACSSSGGGPGAATSGASSSTPGFTPSAGPTKGAASFSASAVPTSSSSSSSSSASGGACTGSQLRISGALDPGGGAAGHERAILVFTNTSGTTCTLYGYPGVDGIPPRPGSGQVQHFRRTLSGAEGGPGSRRTVTLAPGAQASAIAEASSVPSGGASDCEPFQNLMVTAPNTTRTVTLAINTLPSCDPQIHPVVAGATG